MSAKFSMGDNLLEIFDFRCDDWNGTIPYNTGFKVHVRSDGENAYGESWEEFSGTGAWECDIKDFRTFVAQMEKMYQLCTEQVVLEDIAYGGKLCFDLDRAGHIRVGGTLFGAHGDQSLNFVFLGDQTALGPFVDELKEFLKR